AQSAFQFDHKQGEALKRHTSKTFCLASQRAAAPAMPRVGQLPRYRHGTFVTRPPRDNQMKPHHGAAPQFFKQLGDDFLCGNLLERPLLDLLGEGNRGMLKITTYDNGNRTVLELDGKLVGPWMNSYRVSRNFLTG